MFSFFSGDCQNVRETGNLKDFLDLIVDIADEHTALLVHGLLRGEDDTKSGGGNVFERREIEREVGNDPAADIKLAIDHLKANMQ